MAEEESVMLAGIDALFGGGGKDDARGGNGNGGNGGLTSSAASTNASELGDLNTLAQQTQGPDLAARDEYIKRFQLDTIFTAAVDRAMRHNVSSPVEFIAHELMRTAQQQAPPTV